MQLIWMLGHMHILALKGVAGFAGTETQQSKLATFKSMVNRGAEDKSSGR